jgi:hypothetical protein
MSLEEEKKENESAPCARVIGIVLETRPDQISKASLLRKRRCACPTFTLFYDGRSFRLCFAYHSVLVL